MWVIALVAGIFLLFVLLLAVPVDLAFSVERDGSFRLRMRVRWMFGLIGKDIGGRKKKRREEGVEKEKPKKRRGSAKALLAALTTEGFPQKLFSFVRDILRLSKIRQFRMNFRVGLGDPAETGMLFAVLAPAMLVIRSFSSADIQLEPDFEQERLQGYCKGNIRAVPIKLVRPLIPFVFSTATMRAMKAMVTARRK